MLVANTTSAAFYEALDEELVEWSQNFVLNLAYLRIVHILRDATLGERVPFHCILPLNITWFHMRTYAYLAK